MADKKITIIDIYGDDDTLIPKAEELYALLVLEAYEKEIAATSN